LALPSSVRWQQERLGAVATDEPLGLRLPIRHVALDLCQLRLVNDSELTRLEGSQDTNLPGSRR